MSKLPNDQTQEVSKEKKNSLKALKRKGIIKEKKKIPLISNVFSLSRNYSGNMRL